eukprot:INCI10268.1.p1 GENE.INCI10268.1~~INCI10268.1.p1  ORF type:complete len:727 (-),score=136.20 INCI10268.1:472-2652(-)
MSSSGGASERRISEGNSENVKVFVRIRPKSRKEKNSGDAVVVQTVDSQRIGIANKQSSTTFDFDGVFGCEASQEEVYNQCVRPYVDEILQGFSCVVFAYGQTGTGKTHTMQGCYGEDRNNRDGYGMIPRVSEEIFHRLESMNVEFSMRASCIELYNEELKDLLYIPGSQDRPIKIQDSGDARGEVLMNVEEVPVTSAAQIYTTLMKAMSRRVTAQTGMNDRSSRSHALFSLKVQIKETDPITGDQRVKIGQLNLVDLAGSECSSDSKSRGKRAAEAKNINQSLVTLGRVITALVKQDGYIPYRDSKLTRLLKESLGGKARTCIIATVSPCRTQAKESKNTLNYAQNAKEIRNRPVQNCQLSHASLIKNLEGEILTLKRTLKAQYAKNGVVLEKSAYDVIQKELRQLREQTKSQSAALGKAEQKIAAMEAANRAEVEGVRATWDAVIGSNAEVARRVSGEAGVGAVYHGPPSLKLMAEALETAQSQILEVTAQRDAALVAQTDAASQLESLQTQDGSKGSIITKLEEQAALLKEKNARLEAKVMDLTTQLVESRADTAAEAEKLVASQGVFDAFVATMQQAVVTAKSDMPIAVAGGVVTNKHVVVASSSAAGTPIMTPGLAAQRKLSSGNGSNDENDAPGSRRVSKGKEIFNQATTSSPLKYGGQPVEHVPETPVAFSAKNGQDGLTGSKPKKNNLTRILSLTAEYKSSRVQELRNGGQSRVRHHRE